jgi:hypothetical protein
VVDLSKLPTLVALVAAVAACVRALVPGRAALWGAFAAALVALVALLWFFQVSSLPYSPPVSERHVGAWLALLGAPGLTAFVAWRLRRERDLGPEPPDLFARRREGGTSS